MTTVGTEFLARWRQESIAYAEGRFSRRMQKPITRAYIRQGYFQRGNDPWVGDDINAVVVGGDNDNPWQSTYTPTTEWTELPNVISCDIKINIDGSKRVGLGDATVVVENIAFREQSGFSGLYHAIERGWLAPWRGMDTDFTPPSEFEENEWFQILDQKAQIKIFQGYGNDTIVPTFVGFIDDLDLVSRPDQITITARDAGQLPTDQRFFGWAKERSHPDPVTFADRLNSDDEERTEGWILVDDVADIVKLILRWCGFKEWTVESTNMRMREKYTWNRDSFLQDAIDWCCEKTGYVFYIDDPGTDDDSLGIPTFRENRALYELDPEEIPIVTEDDLLKRAQVTFTNEPLAHIIRVRGRTATKDAGGVVVSRDDRRLLAVYRPPWVTSTSPSGVRTARIIQHTLKDYPYLKTQGGVDYAALLVALYQALASATCVVEIPANPGIVLDQHVLLTDTGTGLNTRLWTSARTSSYTSGREPKWTMTIGGALLDTPNMEAMRTEIEAFVEDKS